VDRAESTTDGDVGRAESTTDGNVDMAESTTDVYHSIEGQIFYWHTHRQDQSGITLSKNEVSVCDDTAQVGWAHSLQNPSLFIFFLLERDACVNVCDEYSACELCCL